MTMVINNEPWFVGKDVAMMLGYTDTRKAIRMHVDDDDKGGRKLLPPLEEDNKSPLSTRAGFMLSSFQVNFHRRRSSSVGWQARCLGMRNQKMLSQGMWMQKIKGGEIHDLRSRKRTKPHPRFRDQVLINVSSMTCFSLLSLAKNCFVGLRPERRRGRRPKGKPKGKVCS